MLLRSARYMAIRGISTNEYNAINRNTSRLKTRFLYSLKSPLMLVRLDHIAR